jgi:hypothetical protein
LNNKTLIIASCLALALSVTIFVRMTLVKRHFDATVRESLKTSDGYDQKFITMVDRLEELLATRANFGYTGGKDPMTGTRRQVVQNVVAEKPRVSPATVVQQPQEEVDPFKLTAIIGDPGGKLVTAIVMDGERSYSVETGDVVGGRKISRITNEAIYMETDSLSYYYDIYGKRTHRIKATDRLFELAPAAPPQKGAPQETTK